MLINNPRTILYWCYKIKNLFKKTVLNNGERYDPVLMKIFGINDLDQASRYYFSKKIIPENHTLLDIACGTGYGTKILADSCSRITGVDISKNAISYAKKHYQKININFIISDIFNFHSTADYITSFETVEHIQLEPQQTILHLLSLAKKGIIFSVPYNEVKGHNKHHLHFNINEATFDFISPSQMTFFYQSTTGAIFKNKKDCENPQSLLVLISHTPSFNDSGFKSNLLKTSDPIAPESFSS